VPIRRMSWRVSKRTLASVIVDSTSCVSSEPPSHHDEWSQ
jgi:hypothetical protein